MELDCTMYDNVKFDRVDDDGNYPIALQTEEEPAFLTIYGCYEDRKTAKCVIFPKGKTTWEGFVPPIAFKDGDIITCTNRVGSFVAIFKEKASDILFKSYVVTSLCKHPLFKINSNASDYSNPRFATEEEKQKLFDAIKANGYRWDAETKTLKKVKPQYPKTYIECANMLNCFSSTYIEGYKYELLEDFQELLICRDAYWKIAGDWEPDWRNSHEYKYIIGFIGNVVIKCGGRTSQHVLVFPTEEMRDAFYENFKRLIEACKELL